MEKVVSINSGDLLYRARPPNWSSLPDPDNLLSWLLSTKQLSILRLGWSCLKTMFCGTQPWMFLWRKLSRPKGLRGCWTIGIMVGAKVLPDELGPVAATWLVVAKRSSSLLLLRLFSWSWLMLIWMARNLLSIELGESGTFDPWQPLRLAFSNCCWCWERLAESLLLSLGSR